MSVWAAVGRCTSALQIDQAKAMRHISEEAVSAMIDGMLTVDQMRNAAAHMAECGQCRQTYESFSDLKSMFRSQPATAPLPESFWPDTLRRMRTDVDLPASRRNPVSLGSLPIFQNGRRSLRSTGAVAAIATVLVVAVAVPSLRLMPHRAPVGNATQDTIDDADLSSFVVLHADTAASQPLADHDRQRLISANAQTSLVDDTLSDQAGDGDTAL